MKRINKEWWKGADGFYKETGKRIFKGPYESMDVKEEPIVDSGEIVVEPSKKVLDNEEDL
jgi:hypothetical protein